MTSIKKEIITQFEGSTFASHEDVVEWLSLALTRVEEAARKEEREKIKQAFINVYKGAGEVFFPYVSAGNCTAKEEQMAIEEEWEQIEDNIVVSPSEEKEVDSSASEAKLIREVNERKVYGSEEKELEAEAKKSYKSLEEECECYCHYTAQVLITPKAAYLRKDCSHCHSPKKEKRGRS